LLTASCDIQTIVVGWRDCGRARRRLIGMSSNQPTLGPLLDCRAMPPPGSPCDLFLGYVTHELTIGNICDVADSEHIIGDPAHSSIAGCL
jgi:hypothetical protein